MSLCVCVCAGQIKCTMTVGKHRQGMTYTQAHQQSPLYYHCSLFAWSNTIQVVSQCMRCVPLLATAACSMLCETQTSWVAYHNQTSTLAVILIPDLITVDSCVLQLIAVQYISPRIPPLGPMLLMTHRICPSLHPYMHVHAVVCWRPFTCASPVFLQSLRWFHGMWASAACMQCITSICMSWIWFMSTSWARYAHLCQSRCLHFTDNTSILSDSLHDSTFLPLPKTIYFLLHLPVLLWIVFPKAIHLKCALNAPGAGLFAWAHIGLFAREARLCLGRKRFLPRAVSCKRALCSPGANLHTLPAGVMLSFWDALKL